MNNVAIILAGGKGSRLWPLTSDSQPKSLLETLGKKTMLEATLFRASLFADDVFIVTDSDSEYASTQTFTHLGIANENIIIEPVGADTAAAIAFSVARVKERYGSNTTVTLLPVDHQIRNHGAFYRDITFAIESAVTHRHLTLFGVTPSFSATGYGYIKTGKELEHKGRNQLFTIDQFIEKPDQATADQLLKDPDCLWNSGIYIGTVVAFEHTFEKDPTLYDWYARVVHEKNIPMPEPLGDFQFDHKLVEGNSADLQAVIATFDWKDIGTYDELYRSALETDADGNAIKADASLNECTNCLIIGMDKKIVALGLDDIAVVDGPDGILVCQKSQYSQLVGKIATGKDQPGHHE